MSENSAGPKLEQRLAPILALLQKQQVVQTVTQRQVQMRADLIENLLNRQQEHELRRSLSKLNGPDAAHLLQMLTPDKRELVWQELPDKVAAQALVELPEALAEDMVEITPVRRLESLLQSLDTDELADVASLVPPTLLEHAKALLQSNERNWLESSLTWPEDSVGEIMSKDSLIASEDMTVNQAIERVRSAIELPPQTDKLFVINRHKHLMGVVPLISLIRHDGDRRLGDVMDPDVVYFSPHDPAEEAGHAFERYDLVSAPVVDEHLRVIGRLRVEAIMDFLRIRAEEQALAKAGLSGDTDLFGPIWEGARERWPWLCVNLITAFVASRFISLFEGTIEQLVALATLMPIVASIGGNSGHQTAALLIRGLALNHIHHDTLAYIYRKETAISLINGLVWGSVLGVFAWVLYGSPMLGVVMSAAVTLNMVVAALIGISTPVLLDRFDRDPAMGSSVVLTFATDSLGFLLFLGLAALVLV